MNQTPEDSVQNCNKYNQIFHTIYDNCTFANRPIRPPIEQYINI